MEWHVRLHLFTNQKHLCSNLSVLYICRDCIYKTPICDSFCLVTGTKYTVSPKKDRDIKRSGRLGWAPQDTITLVIVIRME